MAQQFHSVFVQISDEQLKLTVNLVFLLEEDKDGSHREFENEYILIDGISKEELSILFEAANEKIETDAMITIIKTVHNQNWLLSDLFLETKEEKELMEKVLELENILLQSNQLDLNSFEEGQKGDIKNALMMAYMTLMQGKFEKEPIQKQLDELKRLLRRKR